MSQMLLSSYLNMLRDSYDMPAEMEVLISGQSQCDSKTKVRENV